MNEQAPKNFEELSIILDGLIFRSKERATALYIKGDPGCYAEQQASESYRHIKDLITPNTQPPQTP